ncbi:hypothetical protein [Streptomyces cavernae]|uniref:hypothetical protein n=1 Tax=Streptomyces cavernae TaxID=2259034 RepID=UPI000FEBF203|nr:hypothetical protein [Streptomyces cavernae]
MGTVRAGAPAMSKTAASKGSTERHAQYGLRRHIRRPQRGVPDRRHGQCGRQVPRQPGADAAQPVQRLQLQLPDRDRQARGVDDVSWSGAGQGERRVRIFRGVDDPLSGAEELDAARSNTDSMLILLSCCFERGLIPSRASTGCVMSTEASSRRNSLRTW